MDEVLNISTEIPEYTIIIDDETYTFASPDEFEYKEFMWMQDVGKKFDRVSKKEYNESIGTKLESLLNEMTHKILPDIPDEVFKKLKDRQKLLIIQKFSELAGVTKPEIEDKTDEENEPE